MSDLFDLALSNGYRLLVLALPALLGVVVGRIGLLGDNEQAIGTLNKYALHIGFPALVFAGVISDEFSLPTQVAFWLVVPLAHAVVVGFAFFGGRFRGTLALTGLFGNVAYLGLPLVVGIYGEAAGGVAALIVAIHVAISVSAGPYLLRRWSGESADGSFGKVLRLPLLWAPFVGLLARGLPRPALVHVDTFVSPLAASAAPVALFLLGLYIWTRRDVLFGAIDGAWAHIGFRLILVPLVTSAVVSAGVALKLLEPDHARLFVVLSAMPAAITTFSIAHDANVGTQVVAATIVRSTILALAWIPLVATLVELAH